MQVYFQRNTRYFGLTVKTIIQWKDTKEIIAGYLKERETIGNERRQWRQSDQGLEPKSESEIDREGQ